MPEMFPQELSEFFRRSPAQGIDNQLMFPHRRSPMIPVSLTRQVARSQ